MLTNIIPKNGMNKKTTTFYRSNIFYFWYLKYTCYKNEELARNIF